MWKFVVTILFINLVSNGVIGCADFLIFLNSGQSSRHAEATRELALSLTNQLEIDNRVHRVALSVGTDPENEVLDFDKIKSNTELNSTIRAWQPQPLTISSKGLESRLERTLKQAVQQKRPNTAIVVVLIDDNGSSAFNTNPTNFGLFSEFVRKRHYVYTLIVSRKAERIRTSLDFAENSVDTGANKDQLRLIASPFTKCQIKLASELRRKPLPRLESPSTSGPVLTTENPINNLQALIVTSHFVTVPVSVRFPTIKVSTSPQPSTITTTQTPSTNKPTTLKPRKPGCQFDIVLLFDLSGNSADNLNKYQQLSQNLIQQSELGPHASQFAAIRYSGRGRADSAFHLNKHSNKTLLLNELEKIQPMGGTTRTAEAMLFAVREFEPKNGGRQKEEIQRHMIVFTDGYSQDDPSDVAQPLAQERIHVYSVAVEDPKLTPDFEQLKLIASDAKSALLDAQFGKVIEQLAPSRCRV